MEFVTLLFPSWEERYPTRSTLLVLPRNSHTTPRGVVEEELTEHLGQFLVHDPWVRMTNLDNI